MLYDEYSKSMRCTDETTRSLRAVEFAASPGQSGAFRLGEMLTNVVLWSFSCSALILVWLYQICFPKFVNSACFGQIWESRMTNCR